MDIYDTDKFQVNVKLILSYDWIEMLSAECNTLHMRDKGRQVNWLNIDMHTCGLSLALSACYVKSSSSLEHNIQKI
jgi:hypothetical protein